MMQLAHGSLGPNRDIPHVVPRHPDTIPLPIPVPSPQTDSRLVRASSNKFRNTPISRESQGHPYHHPWPNLNSHEVAFIFIQFDNNPKDLSPGICPMDWEEVALLSSCSGWPQWSI